MTTIQYAWMIYAAGSLGCCIAAWWMFLWAWRFIRYSAVVTAMTILFTPYAIDPQTMQMAPAIYTLVFNGFILGVPAIMPLIKLMVGIWAIGIILVLVFVLLTRNSNVKYIEPHDNRPRASRASSKKTHSKKKKPARHHHNTAPRRESYPSDNNLTREERQARDEMMYGDLPMRAIRD